MFIPDPNFPSRIPDPGSGSATPVPDILNEITDVIMIAKKECGSDQNQN
jgi:hypothetical protein